MLVMQIYIYIDKHKHLKSYLYIYYVKHLHNISFQKV